MTPEKAGWQAAESFVRDENANALANPGVRSNPAVNEGPAQKDHLAARSHGDPSIIDVWLLRLSRFRRLSSGTR